MLMSALEQFVSKLERRRRLPDADRDAILLLEGVQRDYTAGETIVVEGASTTHCCFVASGFISREKRLPSGDRQILAFHILGDAVDLQSLLFTTSDHRIYANSPTSTFWVSHTDILTLSEARPIVAKALWLDCLVDAAIFREWTANVGQRNALERISHLLLEMEARFSALGLATAGTFTLPLTQAAMAEALGLSLVHLNKTLQVLRKRGWIATNGRSVALLDKPELIRLSGFDVGYLHLDGEKIKWPIGLQTSTATAAAVSLLSLEH